MVSRARSTASKKAWRSRKAKGECPFCGEPVFVGGVKVGGHWYHRNCAERKGIIAARERYAVRGYYAD